VQGTKGIEQTASNSVIHDYPETKVTHPYNIISNSAMRNCNRLFWLRNGLRRQLRFGILGRFTFQGDENTIVNKIEVMKDRDRINNLGREEENKTFR